MFPKISTYPRKVAYLIKTYQLTITIPYTELGLDLHTSHVIITLQHKSSKHSLQHIL